MLYRRIMAGEAGAWAGPIRALLRLAELGYASAVSVRNARYDRNGPRSVVSVPVISVGNLTTGGTGKTPFVIEIVRRLERMGREPAVVARGYKSEGDAPNDEERLIRHRCPGVAYLADPDRAWASEEAHRNRGADVIVLDDGFQHRQLSRSLDIVLIDATCPFGFGHVLPRGLLREPVSSLRRAGMIAITRCDQVSSADLQRIEGRLRSVASDPVLLKCKHQVTSIDRLDGSEITGSLEGKRVVLFAGLAHPRAFATTVLSTGVEIVAHRWWPDHYRYRRRDVERLLDGKGLPPHDLLLTTEKDAVKLQTMSGLDGGRIGVVKVAIDFVDDGGTILQSMLNETLGCG